MGVHSGACRCAVCVHDNEGGWSNESTVSQVTTPVDVATEEAYMAAVRAPGGYVALVVLARASDAAVDGVINRVRREVGL